MKPLYRYNINVFLDIPSKNMSYLFINKGYIGLYLWDKRGCFVKANKYLRVLLVLQFLLLGVSCSIALDNQDEKFLELVKGKKLYQDGKATYSFSDDGLKISMPKAPMSQKFKNSPSDGVGIYKIMTSEYRYEVRVGEKQSTKTKISSGKSWKVTIK